MWTLQSETKDKRTYKNSVTGSECIQTKCRTDKEGNNWWEFNDLITLPFTRTFAANKVTALFAMGITPEDANTFFAKMKAILRGKDDGEKYETAFGELQQFENKFKSATDPVKQLSSLVCVYYTMNDEPIDSFSGSIQQIKLSLLEADPQMHNFFLQRQIKLIERSQAFLNPLSPIASQAIEPTGTN